MNRRDFLQIAAAAPVALPFAIKAAAAQPQFAVGGELMNFTPGFVGEMASETIVPWERAPLRRLTSAELRIATLSCRLPTTDDPVVTDQMIEHDLFEAASASRETSPIARSAA